MRKTFLLCAVLMLGFASPAWADDLRISREWLSKNMDAADLVILDVRQPHDYKTSPNKIKGAQRREPGQVKNWAGELDKNKTYVLYCS